jgi:hypothetical protein
LTDAGYAAGGYFSPFGMLLPGLLVGSAFGAGI